MPESKIYADEHMHSVVVKILRQNGFDIKTVFDAKIIYTEQDITTNGKNLFH